MKFTTISDTHGKHHSLVLLAGDVLIHAGDVSSRGKESEIVYFLEWFAKQDYERKIFVVGNHDFYFERMPKANLQNITFCKLSPQN
jgi:predicted phosphodiesterase